MRLLSLEGRRFGRLTVLTRGGATRSPCGKVLLDRRTPTGRFIRLYTSSVRRAR